MSFGESFGCFLDKLVEHFDKIHTECRLFADECVLMGYVPPHPLDLIRAGIDPKNKSEDPEIVEIKKNNVNDTKYSEVDEVIIRICNSAQHPSSQTTIFKILKEIKPKNESPQVIRARISELQKQGRIRIETSDNKTQSV